MMGADQLVDSAGEGDQFGDVVVLGAPGEELV
jgi:hypothetical protein